MSLQWNHDGYDIDLSMSNSLRYYIYWEFSWDTWNKGKEVLHYQKKNYSSRELVEKLLSFEYVPRMKYKINRYSSSGYAIDSAILQERDQVQQNFSLHLPIWWNINFYFFIQQNMRITRSILGMNIRSSER